MQHNDWKIPLNVAIGIHVFVLLGAMYLPGIFKAKPKFADIYTVSIINIADPNVGSPPAAQLKQAPPPPSVKQKQSAPPPVKRQEVPPTPAVITPTKSQKIAPIAEPRKKLEPATPKSISLKPLKKKLIQEKKPIENQVKNQELERKKRQELAKSIREEELLAEKAKLAQEALRAERKLAEALRADQLLAEKANLAQTALQAERNLLNEQAQMTSSAISGNRTSAQAGGSSNIIESQYLASVFNRLHQFWAPPEYLQQNPNLTAVVVITINYDGKIANMLFESKSGDRVFDQFVSKTIELADPMPPIPPAMKKQRFEIGLRFRPGSIQ